MMTQVHISDSGRLKALVIPREHGAWGILLVPLVVGACLGSRYGSGLRDIILFLTAAIAIFWLRTPVESLLGTGVMRAHGAHERRAAFQVAFCVAGVAAAAVAALLYDGYGAGLLFIAFLAGAAFAVQSALKLFGRSMRMPSQILGAAGLTSTAAGAYYVSHGFLDHHAAAIWFACWLFAGDQIHYVQLRVHSSRAVTVREKMARGRNFFLGQLVLLGAAGAACRYGLLPPLAVLAFVPVVIRGAMWFGVKQGKLDLPWLGITELLHSITFAVLLITSYYLVR